MAAQLAPSPILRFFDNNGNALAGGLLYTYQSGTSTPQATYTDATGGTPNANPVVLNARGEASVWFSAGLSYRLLAKDSAGNTLPGYPVDGVTSGNPSSFMSSVITASDAPTARSLLGAMANDSSSITAVAGGLADAITAAFTPTNITALTNGLRVTVTGCSANATTTPTLAAGTTPAVGIVKNNNLPLVAGDINGDAVFQYSSAYTKWVLLNPVNAVTGSAFVAQRLSSNQSSGTTAIFDFIMLQVGGSNYNNGTGVFTAPIAGWYLLTTSLYIQNTTGVAVETYAQIIGGTATGTAQVHIPIGAYGACNCSVITHLNAGGTAYVSFPGAFSANLQLWANTSQFQGKYLGG